MKIRTLNKIYWTALMLASSAPAALMAQSCDPPPSGIVSWWPGDGNADDIVGGNNGSMVGAGFAPGLVNDCFDFAGGTQYMEATDQTHGWAQGTVEFWFNANQWNYSVAPAGLMLWTATGAAPPSGSYDGMDLGNHPQNTTPGELMFGIWDGAQWHWAHSAVVPQLGTWYHVAGTWGPLGIQIYVNGVIAGNNPYTGSAPSYTQYNVIGHSSWSGSGFDGLIDEVSIYNRALSADEIAAIYSAGSAGKCEGATVPKITWATPAPITYGAALTSFQLDASANVPGTFVYDPASGMVLNAGTNILSAYFTPDDTTNYESTSDSVDLTVLLAPLVAQAINTSRLYGEANPPFSGIIGGLVNSDSITLNCTCSAGTNSPIGKYPIVPNLVDPGHKASNYALMSTNGVLTVLPAPLTVTASNVTRLLGTANPVFSGTITGLMNGDNITASYSTTATINSPPGKYLIVPSLIPPTNQATNYSVTLIDGTLTVIGPPVILTAQLSGGTLTFTWSAAANETYQIQAASSLSPANWGNLSGTVVATNSIMAISEFVGTNSQQFYRVVLTQ